MELVRITRPAAARIVHDTLTGLGLGNARMPWAGGGHYDKWHCLDNQDRTWTFMSDGSVGSSPGTSWSGHCEVVTPPLRHEDMPALQAIVRALREGGAKTNHHCGLHVHVEAIDLGGPQLRALQLLWSRWEDHFILAADVHPERTRWCGRSSRRFVTAMRTTRPDAATPEMVRAAWYDRPTAPRRDDLARYDSSRYVALNYHALTWHGTVELRLWNSTLHAGAVRAAVMASVALVACALTVKRAHGTPVAVTPQSAGNFRQFLLRSLGLTGADNVPVVKHLLAPLMARGMRVQGWARLPAGSGRRGPAPAPPPEVEPPAASAAPPPTMTDVQIGLTGVWSAAAETAQYAPSVIGISVSGRAFPAHLNLEPEPAAPAAQVMSNLRIDTYDAVTLPRAEGVAVAGFSEAPQHVNCRSGATDTVEVASEIVASLGLQVACAEATHILGADVVFRVDAARGIHVFSQRPMPAQRVNDADLRASYPDLQETLAASMAREVAFEIDLESASAVPPGAVNHNRRVYGQATLADAAAQLEALASPVRAFGQSLQACGSAANDVVARATAESANRLTAEMNREVTEQLIADLTGRPPHRFRRPARSAT